MVPQLPKILNIVPPQAIVDNASWTVTTVDRKGYDYAFFIVTLGAMDIAMTALSVGESDTDGSFSSITGCVFGTSHNSTGSASTLPAATDDNKVYVFGIDLKGRKRYLKLVATGGDGSNGTYLAAQCLLYNAEQPASTAAEAGVAQLLQVPTFA